MDHQVSNVLAAARMAKKQVKFVVTVSNVSVVIAVVRNAAHQKMPLVVAFLCAVQTLGRRAVARPRPQPLVRLAQVVLAQVVLVRELDSQPPPPLLRHHHHQELPRLHQALEVLIPEYAAVAE